MSHDSPTFTSNWNFPSAVRFGVGRIAEVGAAAKSLGMTRPLVVTDPGVAQLSMLSEIQALLRAAGLGDAVFSDVDPNPDGIF